MTIEPKMAHVSRKRNNLEFEIILLLASGGSFHLRRGSSLIHAPLSTLRRAVARLAHRSIIDFAIEGKNKSVFLKKTIDARFAVYGAEYYKAQKLFLAYPTLSVVVESLLKQVDSPLIIVFGSYAKFCATSSSDIDIYIETMSRTIKRKAEMVHSKLSVKSGRFSADSYLGKEVIHDHIILRGVERFYDKCKLFE